MPEWATTTAEDTTAPAVVEIVYYTDPLCCWSWAFEPQWRLLRYTLAGKLSWRYRMGGLISDWNAYNDPINAVHRPGQMGPLWLQAQHVTGSPLDARIWIEDPPSSSWPACRAVKAAELQSPRAADLYLRRLRQAVMTERSNVSRQEVLFELADQCARNDPGTLDPMRLQEDLDGPAARAAFRDDVKDARFRGIGRFPALVVRKPRTTGTVLIGWRPFHILLDEVRRVAPEIGELPSLAVGDSPSRGFSSGSTREQIGELVRRPHSE